MNIVWKNNLESINWNELCHLFEIAPLSKRTPDKLKITFTNSMFKWFVFDGDKLIGVGRALADGASCSYICDIALDPEYQGLGLGKQIVQRLMDDSKDHKKIILYANPGKEGFYAKLGFKMMNTAMAIFRNEEEVMANGIISEYI